MTTALHEQYPAPHPATMLQIMQIQRLRCATEGTMPRSETVIKVSYRTEGLRACSLRRVGQELRDGVASTRPGRRCLRAFERQRVWSYKTRGWSLTRWAKLFWRARARSRAP